MVLSLEAELASGSTRCRDAWLFYYTDNSPTYHIVDGGSSTSGPLQALAHRIKSLELLLGCTIVCIHPPGFLVLIQHGADGLSRGVWISPLHKTVSTRQLLHNIFSPMLLTGAWRQWLQSTFMVDSSGPLMTDLDHQWDARGLFHRNSIWIPAPEIAAQAISFCLEAWAESPSDTSFVFLVPRILTRRWINLSAHVQDLGQIAAGTTPCIGHSVPVMVLVIRPFVRSLESPSFSRLDPSSLTNYRKFQGAKAHLRGLSGLLAG